MRAEAPPRGGSQNSPRGLRHENNTAPTEAELANLQRTLFLNEANAACGAASPATTEVTIHRAGRLRPAQHCKLQKTISKKNDCKQPQTNNDFLYPPRHYAASGLLNLPTTLTKAVTPVTPGVKLPGTKNNSKENSQRRPNRMCKFVPK